MTTSCVEYDFSELRGRIKTVFGTECKFAEAIGRTPQYVSQIFNGKKYFDMQDISNSANVLDIESSKIGFFFYTTKVHISEQQEGRAN